MYKCFNNAYLALYFAQFLPYKGYYDIFVGVGNHRAIGGFTLLFFTEGVKSPPVIRKEGDTMITYSDLIQTGIFIVALVSLCYTIFKGKR